MILVTGATGFIGRALLRHLFEAGRDVRVLIRPSRRSPRLPRSLPVEVAVVSLSDERAIGAALKGVDQIIHLAGAESQGRNANLLAVDMQGTEHLARAAAEAGIKRFVYLSHIGASRSSGFPVFKAKGIAEEHIKRGRSVYHFPDIGRLRAGRPLHDEPGAPAASGAGLLPPARQRVGGHSAAMGGGPGYGAPVVAG